MPNREILASPDIAESEEGAVLLNSGYTALGKVMAGSGGIQFTKAELDSGDLPEGTAVEDLTAPVEYAGDAMIAKCENTGTRRGYGGGPRLPAWASRPASTSKASCSTSRTRRAMETLPIPIFPSRASRSG